MSNIRLRPILTGEALRVASSKVSLNRPWVVDGFIYERSITLISADPGAGKSSLAICAAAQMSNGSPVFGALRCAHPIRSYYLIGERSVQEPLERLKLIAPTVRPNWDNIVLDDGFSGIADVTREESAGEILNALKTAWAPDMPNLVWVDPAYAFVRGGLSKDEGAANFGRFLARVASETGASVVVLHHTVKPSYASSTGERVEKDDPFYGSVWLKAAATAAFYLRRDGNSTTLLAKKDSYSVLHKSLPLNFDPLTHLLHADPSMDSATVVDRALLWLGSQRPGMELGFEGLKQTLNCSDSTLRRLLADPRFESRMEQVKVSGKATLFRVKTGVCHEGGSTEV